MICDRIAAWVKGRVYNMVLRPAAMYGLLMVAKSQEAELKVAELKMLRLSLGVTRIGKIRND